MDLFEAVEKRHSYRGEFKNEKVSREDLKKIVQTGIQAPSGCNAQTTKFVIIDDEELLVKIRELLNKSYINTVQACIVCLAEDFRAFRNMSFSSEDYSAAVENMLLAITASGYASVWLDGVLRIDQLAEKIGALIHAPDKHRVCCLLPVGIPVNPGKQKEKKPFNQRAWFNRYEAQ